MRSLFFRVVTQRRLVLCYGRFETTNPSQLRGSSSPRKCLTLEDWVDRLSRNVGNKTTILRCVTFQKSSDLKFSDTFKYLQKMLRSSRGIAACYGNYTNPTSKLRSREILLKKKLKVPVISNICKPVNDKNSCNTFGEHILSLRKFVTPAPHPLPPHNPALIPEVIVCYLS